MINVISCVSTNKNKLAIGRAGNLLFTLKDDMNFFKNLTTNSLGVGSGLDKNIVLMGRKTFFSIPSQFRPLENRINIVLTRDEELVKLSPVPKDLKLTKQLYFTELSTFEKIYVKYNPNVFVIGGADLYNQFMNRADKLYITHVQSPTGKDVKFHIGEEPDTFIHHFSSAFSLSGYSERFFSTYDKHMISYRVLYYNKSSNTSEEYKYMNQMNEILTKGNIRKDRTGTGTISLFGTQMRFDISRSIPLLTTKRVPFKTIVEELLWFCRGDTDAKILQNKAIKIWDGNTSRDFLDKRGLEHYPEGIIGPQYGFLWRHFGAKYSPIFADTTNIDTSVIGGVDQLKYVENLLQNDPFSRRIIISAWNPPQLAEQVLPSCHLLIQFYVTEEHGQRYLSCMFTMRSSDFPIASGFNCVCYTILTYILAAKYNMKPKELIYVAGDTHIYQRHIQGVKEQLTRTPRPFPTVKLAQCIKDKEWKDITVDDFELIGYFPHPGIKMEMAI